MNATAANLIEQVLPPQSALRQWVLTFPYSWRRRLAQDGALLGRLTRIAVETVLTFYAARAGQEGGLGARSGAVTAVQRTSSDLRLNPHLHMIVLDGTWCEKDGELAWEGLGHVRTSEVGEVLERLVRRMEGHLRRSGLLRPFEDEAEEGGEGDWPPACPHHACTPSATRACWPRRARGGRVSRRSLPKPPPRAPSQVGRITRGATAPLGGAFGAHLRGGRARQS